MILHVDMDAFFAAVAIRERPELAERPVIVGGAHRGVVLSASYPARRFGVHSGMPMSQARRICPGAVVLSPRYTDFDGVSAAVMEIFAQVTPRVQAMSLDEAFLDVTGSLRRFGSPRAIAEHVRARVHDEQRITCSVGIAPTRTVAKVASRRAKPDGVLDVPAERVVDFLHPLDVGELYGVGEKTRARLHRIGLRTVGEVARTPLPTLRRALGPHAGSHVHALAWGEGDRRLAPAGYFGHGGGAPEHSIGSDETFGRDTADPEVILREVLRLSTAVGRRVRRAEMVGRTVSLKVRYSDFTTITRSRTLSEHTDLTSELHATASALFAALGAPRRVRLVGVRLEGLRPRCEVHRQLELGAREHGWSDADRAVDAATLRFGRQAVVPASLITADRP